MYVRIIVDREFLKTYILVCIFMCHDPLIILVWESQSIREHQLHDKLSIVLDFQSRILREGSLY